MKSKPPKSIQTFIWRYVTCGTISKWFIPFNSNYQPEIKKKYLFLAVYILTCLKSQTSPNINPSLPSVVRHLVVKFMTDPLIFTQVIVQTVGKCLFQAYVVSNYIKFKSYSKKFPNFPLVVWHLVIQFQIDLFTNSKVIVWRSGKYMILVHNFQNVQVLTLRNNINVTIAV